MSDVESPRLVADLTVRYEDFSLELALEASGGRTLALLGPNGAGKSTVLGALAGIVPISSGGIVLGHRALHELPPEHRRVGYVFQDYLLFPHLSVLENVAFGPRALGHTRHEARVVAGEWLERLGISHLAARLPQALSGGQAQRVALARALAVSPEMLLLDEPLSALDVELRAEVRAELAVHLRQYTGVTIVVTHSFADVQAFADDVIVLENGRATQRASVDDLRANPATHWAQRLVAESMRSDGG